jgi:hypothetical protein
MNHPLSQPGQLIHQLSDFMQTATDWCFSATHATAQKIEDFKIENMAKSIKSDAPHIWTMFSGLLRAETKNMPANEVNSRPNDVPVSLHQ